MNRRQLIAAAPAIMAFPMASSGQAETPIMALFREWQRLHDYLNYGAGCSLPEAEHEVGCNELTAIEDRIEAYPAQNAQDIIAKLLSWSSYGDFDISTNEAFWEEARTFVEAPA